MTLTNPQEEVEYGHKNLWYSLEHPFPGIKRIQLVSGWRGEDLENPNTKMENQKDKP